MSATKRNLLILAIGLVMGVGLTIGQGVMATRDSLELTPLPLDELRTFSAVYSNIKQNYVEDVEDETLLEDAIRGMISGLDPHSSYLDKEDYTDLRVGTSGEFGGLGIEVGMEDGFVKVISPIDDTPAQRAGLVTGDLIVRLDDTPVKGMTLKEAVDIMRGKPKTDILLTIIREGEAKPIKVTITRDIIKVKSVKNRMLGDGFGYIRISQFQINTGDNLLSALDSLKEENKADLSGLVLDLRNNPGGILNAAIDVSDAFLTEGLIVYTEGRALGSKVDYVATPDDVLSNAPIVVLLNGGSASASEIVAGALQDHKRAIIMGEKSFGKGSVQTIIPLREGAALKLTTQRYYTPSGRSIQAEGIIPDIELEKVSITTVKDDFTPITEASLAGHLTNGKSDNEGNSDGDDEDKTAATDDDKPKASLASTDYQLYEALNLLKGLKILNQRM